MKSITKNITVFEHQSLKLDRDIDEKTLYALQSYSGSNGVPYFSLIHNGIRLNEYVGVIQVGNIIIEVLPKADNLKETDQDKSKWRNILIGMLKTTGGLDVHIPSSSSLRYQSNSILDLYFELFIKEVEYLLHSGLTKKYRKKEANVTSLKGCLQFNKHIQLNIAHQERFFVRHTTYDVEHMLHIILFKTINLLKNINTNVSLHGRIHALLLHFPSMPDIKVSEAIFEKLVFNRKTGNYKSAINISKLLLLRYHPDVVAGRNDVLALMFDMNLLWEKFVYKSLYKYKHDYPGTTIRDQYRKLFWQSATGSRTRIIPDIVVNEGQENCIVLDTKWKNLNGYNPSPDDLRQMYVYHEYYSAKSVALIYPGKESFKSGVFLDPKREHNQKECAVISLEVKTDLAISTWQKYISDYIFNSKISKI